MSIQDTVDVSGNERWKVNFAHIIIDADFLSRDIHITNVAILVTVSLPRSCTTCWGVSTISITATSTTARPQHHKLSQSIIARKEHSIVQWKSVLAFCNLFQTEVGSERMDRKGSMFKKSCQSRSSLMKFSIISFNRGDWHGSIQNVCRGTHHREAQFVGKQKTWMSAGKVIQVNTGTDVLTSNATTSLFARLLVIARSTRECRSGRGDRDA